MNKRQAKQAAIDNGREHLKTWLNQAIERGTIYYQVAVSSSGMTRYVKLYRVTPGDTIGMLWPAIIGLDRDVETVLGGYYHALHEVAKDWGFNSKRRTFVVKGCGMDMVAHLVNMLGRMAGIEDVLTRVHLTSLE